MSYQQGKAFENALRDLNACTSRQLTSIPGITKSLADAIIKYRQKHQGYKYFDELWKISIINRSKFQILKRYFCVPGEKVQSVGSKLPYERDSLTDTSSKMVCTGVTPKSVLNQRGARGLERSVGVNLALHLSKCQAEKAKSYMDKAGIRPQTTAYRLPAPQRCTSSRQSLFADEELRASKPPYSKRKHQSMSAGARLSGGVGDSETSKGKCNPRNKPSQAGGSGLIKVSEILDRLGGNSREDMCHRDVRRAWEKKDTSSQLIVVPHALPSYDDENPEGIHDTYCMEHTNAVGETILSPQPRSAHTHSDHDNQQRKDEQVLEVPQPSIMLQPSASGNNINLSCTINRRFFQLEPDVERKIGSNEAPQKDTEDAMEQEISPIPQQVQFLDEPLHQPLAKKCSAPTTQAVRLFSSPHKHESHIEKTIPVARLLERSPPDEGSFKTAVTSIEQKSVSMNSSSSPLSISNISIHDKKTRLCPKERQNIMVAWVNDVQNARYCKEPDKNAIPSRLRVSTASACMHPRVSGAPPHEHPPPAYVKDEGSKRVWPTTRRGNYRVPSGGGFRGSRKSPERPSDELRKLEIRRHSKVESPGKISAKFPGDFGKNEKAASSGSSSSIGLPNRRAQEKIKKKPVVVHVPTSKFVPSANKVSRTKSSSPIAGPSRSPDQSSYKRTKRPYFQQYYPPQSKHTDHLLRRPKKARNGPHNASTRPYGHHSRRADRPSNVQDDLNCEVM